MLEGHVCIYIGVLYRHHSPLIRIGGEDTSPKNMKAESLKWGCLLRKVSALAPLFMNIYSVKQRRG